MREPEFDFARAEDKDAASEAKIKRLAEVYLDKARKNGASETALAGDQGPFRDHLREHPPGRAGPAGRGAEPRRGPPGVRRAGLPPAALEGGARRRRRVLSLAARDGRAESRRRRARHDRQRADVAPFLLPRRPAGRGRRRPAAVGLRPGQPAELLPLVEHARRRAAGPRRRRRPAPARGAGGRGPAHAARRPRPRPGDRVRRQLARLPPLRGAQQRRSRRGSRRFNDELRRAMFEEPIRFFVDLVQQRSRRCSSCSTRKYTFVNPALARHYGMPDADGSGPTNGCGSTTRAGTAAAGCCRWRSS